MNTRISETKSPPSAFDSFERYSRMLNSLAGRIAIVIASVLYNIIALPFAAVSYLAQKVVTIWNESKKADVLKANGVFFNQTDQYVKPYLDPVEEAVRRKKESEMVSATPIKEDSFANKAKLTKKQKAIKKSVTKRIEAKSLSHKNFNEILKDWEKASPKDENRKEAVIRIKKFAFINKPCLDLSNLQLSSLPNIFLEDLSGAYRFLNMQELNLKDNKLTFLPESIKNLKSLQKLNLEGNQITALPKEALEKLITLHVLNLKGNQIAVLPENIFDNLKALLNLDLGNNQIRELPENIFDHLKLNTLSLKANELKALPKSFNKLLPSLRMLNLKDSLISKDDLKMINKHKDLRFLHGTTVNAKFFKKKANEALKQTSEMFKTLGKAS